MARKKILWLCSWYPGKTQPFNGDFIQRHARSAALFNDIHVIHVIGDGSGSLNKTVDEEVIQSDHLTEQIINFKRSYSLPGKIAANYREQKLYKEAVKKYIRQNGLPSAVHVHVPMKAGIIACWIKKRYNVPFVVTEHWGIYNDIEVLNYNRRSSIFKNYTQKIFTEAAAFLSVSRFLAEGVNKLVVKKAYSIIPNVVDTQLFFAANTTTYPFRFIHVSNIVPLKNVEGILRAFLNVLKVNPQAELIIVGDKDPAIRQYAKQLGLEAAVRFTGEVPYEVVASSMKDAHCFVLFSDIENSPCVIGEALCCGLIVIATNVGGIPELLDSSNGLLVNPRDEKELPGKMLEVMTNFPIYDRQKIADAAKSKFNYEVVGKAMDEIYDSIIPK